MAEFNYTIDDANQSFEEILRMLAGVSCCNDRRLNRQIYFELERAGREPYLLFNHRNKRPVLKLGQFEQNQKTIMTVWK
ncbi:hypothetical protein BANRA_02772 [Acinetobacter baumannii]|nr:hypothetical protein BANRA_02772 [Acinetobacter baumannii]